MSLILKLAIFNCFLDDKIAHDIIFRERIGEARDELMRMLAEDELREAVLLIFANKQDLPNAMSASELTEKLGLNELRNRRVSDPLFLT